MHEKYAKEDVVVLSVSLDDPKEREGKGSQSRTRAEIVLAFLQQQKADFKNLILDENQEFWTEKFGFIAPPCVFVFNRDGKWRRFSGKKPHAEAEKLVERYLKK